MNEIERIFYKYAEPDLTSLDMVEVMGIGDFKLAITEALEKQRELSVVKFKEACIELNADKHYHEPLLELAILTTKLEEQE